MTGSLDALEAELIDCRRCPRLVEWREHTATAKRAAFADEDYWGRPLPGFGDPDARIVLVGLAPAAHGANRTGRMFTGDRSGDWLMASMHRVGLANQPRSAAADDGLELTDTWVTAAVRCAPPGNRPLPAERDECGGWLDAELALLRRARVLVCLGGFAYQAVWRHLGRRRIDRPRPRPRFGHGLRVECDGFTVLAGYHPSQQNTFTGKLTEDMMDGLLRAARQAVDGGVGDQGAP